MFKFTKEDILNKSLLTNIVAFLIMVIGYFLPIFYGEVIFTIGVFALSGSITNWLAVYMLFERIPFIYGSGVIPSRFEDFKTGIKNLIINEFFNKKHIEKFFEKNGSISIDAINNKIDFDKVFHGLVEAIIESPMGGMVNMFGGKDALQPLKEPIITKMKNIVAELASENSPGDKSDFTENLTAKIEHIIDNRLADLTPKMVKEIIQRMIRKHLGWLVVWGGVFGGFIGFIFAVA